MNRQLLDIILRTGIFGVTLALGVTGALLVALITYASLGGQL